MSDQVNSNNHLQLPGALPIGREGKATNRSRRPPTLPVRAGGAGARLKPRSDVPGLPGDPCRTPSGREASHTHHTRLQPTQHELVSNESAWQELEARGATMASVPFSGRADRGGRVDRMCSIASTGASWWMSSDGPPHVVVSAIAAHLADKLRPLRESLEGA